MKRLSRGDLHNLRRLDETRGQSVTEWSVQLRGAEGHIGGHRVPAFVVILLWAAIVGVWLVPWGIGVGFLVGLVLR